MLSGRSPSTSHNAVPPPRTTRPAKPVTTTASRSTTVHVNRCFRGMHNHPLRCDGSTAGQSQPQRAQPSPSEQSVRSSPQSGSKSKIPASRATLFHVSEHRMPITKLIHRGLVDERSLDLSSADRPDRNANPEVSDAQSPRHDIGLGP